MRRGIRAEPRRDRSRYRHDDTVAGKKLSRYHRSQRNARSLAVSLYRKEQNKIIKMDRDTDRFRETSRCCLSTNVCGHVRTELAALADGREGALSSAYLLLHSDHSLGLFWVFFPRKGRRWVIKCRSEACPGVRDRDSLHLCVLTHGQLFSV